MGKSNSKALIVLAFFSIYVIWGSTYSLNKIAVAELPPFLLAGIRFSIAGLLIFGITKLLGKSVKINLKQLKNTTIAGFLFLSFGNGVVVWALKYVDSNFAALEIAAQPLVVLIMMRILQGKRIKLMSMIGVALGVTGMYLLVSQQQIVTNPKSIIGAVMIFACMLSWGYGSLFVATANMPKNFFVNTGYQMFTGGIMLIIASLAFNEPWPTPNTWSPTLIWVIVILIIFGSIVAFTSFNYLLRIVSPEKVATSTYVNPIIAMFLGWYFLDEQISAQSVVAALVLLTGVYFINASKKPEFLNKKNKQTNL